MKKVTGSNHVLSDPGHYEEFKDQYDERYARIYGIFRVDRITEVVEEFLKCGDCKEGLARKQMPEF